MGDLDDFHDRSDRPGVSFDPLDLRKEGAQEASRQAAQFQADAAHAGIGEQRRQFDLTTARLAPFVQAGLARLPGVVDASTAGGLDARLSAIMRGEGFANLLDERAKAVNNGLAQGGLTRSGAALREAARIPTDVALALENEIFGRERALLGSGQNAAAGLGAFGADQADSITELLRRSGDAYAQNAIAQGQIAAGRTQNAVGAVSAIASMFFSDPRLKENMEPIGKIGPLTLYEWDWIPAVRGLTGMEMSIGFSADEVAERYPEYVIEFAGFHAIDYHGLTDRLKAELSVARALT